MNAKELGKALLVHNMLIYAKQAVTSPQYNICTYDIMWEQNVWPPVGIL